MASLSVPSPGKWILDMFICLGKIVFANLFECWNPKFQHFLKQWISGGSSESAGRVQHSPQAPAGGVYPKVNWKIYREKSKNI